ncbi:Centrosomal protein of 89 kDa [Folsomia candida]|uniref:Centrosomal protein of 89 kDa n=1 Tax=Folsomia candida TaxID=158441 RepID=A0A226F5R8_FOLCA|nr:Centrosomal protein of 89 kDa [Folsomia candida]
MASQRVDYKAANGATQVLNSVNKGRESTSVNNAQGHNRRMSSVKRSKSQRSPNTRIVCGKRKATVDSPTRRLNKKLVHALSESRQSNEYYIHELNKLQAASLREICDLQKENEALSREHVELAQTIEKWKRRCHELRDKNTHFIKLQSVKKQNQALQEDLDVCKSVVCRLNHELMSSQEKLGILDDTDVDTGLQKQDNNQLEMSEAIQNPRTRLFPLLVAYDEVIKEKNETIRGHENTLEHFKTRCREVVNENQDLHKVISDKQGKGTVSVEEWEFLHLNALVVLEENDVLHEKMDLMRNKESVMMRTHEEKVQKLKTKVATLNEEREILKEAVTKSENQCKHLFEQQSRLTEIFEKRIPLDQHEASVQECKNLFEELKLNYNSERSVLVAKLESAEAEKSRLSGEITELEAANARLQTSLSSYEECLASNTEQFKNVYKTMLDATKARDAATIAMEEATRFSQRIIEERDNSDRLLREQRMLNENLVQLRDKQSGLEMEDIHSQEVEKYFGKIQELERSKELLSLDHQQKVVYLETVVDDKSKRIDHLETEKKQLELDLETVWKTTTSTMKELAHAR